MNCRGLVGIATVAVLVSLVVPSGGLATEIEEGSGEVLVEEGGVGVAGTTEQGEWQIEIEEEKGGTPTTGQVVLDGGMLHSGDVGDIRWEKTDTSLFGTLLSDDGKEVAYFTAELGGGGPLTGTYTTVGGEEGAWTWNGPVP